MPPKLPIFPGGFVPHLIYGYFGPPEYTPQLHLGWFSRFNTAHVCDQQTLKVRQTDTQTVLQLSVV